MSLKEFDNNFENIIGVDEAGRGPLAGPVVSAAVYIKNYDNIIGLDDSKKLSEKRREKLFDEIFKSSLVGIGIVDNKTIDRINILEATMLSMRKALESFDLKNRTVLVDGNVSIKGIKSTAVIKGDAKSFAIAAASIIAKVTRDRLMKDLAVKYPEYSFEKHKGYGTVVHIEAIKKYGATELHRMSFIKKFI